MRRYLREYGARECCLALGVKVEGGEQAAQRLGLRSARPAFEIRECAAAETGLLRQCFLAESGQCPELAQHLAERQPRRSVHSRWVTAPEQLRCAALSVPGSPCGP